MRAIVIPSREQIAAFETFYARDPPPPPRRAPRQLRWSGSSGRAPPHQEPRLVTPKTWILARERT